MNGTRLPVAVLIALALTLGGGNAATAQNRNNNHRNNNLRRPAGGNNEISINFDNASVKEVIDVMSRVTGKNFIIDPTVKGTVTVIAPTRIPKDDAYMIFESILEMNDISLVPMGSIIKVVPSRDATQKSIPVRKGRKSADYATRDNLITQLIPIQYADAQTITTVLTPLISREANLTTYADTNTIILTETASNIGRLLEIVREIDVPGFEQKITIIPLVNAQADILAQEILQALEPGPGMPGAVPQARGRRRAAAQPVLTGKTTAQIKIIPDLRTNALIIVANEADTEQVLFLVRELDKTTPIEANNIHVYRLKNALAEEVAHVLTSLATTTSPASGQGGGAAAMVTGIRMFYKEVSVVADKTTNALIIIASPQDYAVLKTVIDKLDVMRPQVLVETLIAEVSLDFTRELGVNWLFAAPHGNDEAGFGSYNPSDVLDGLIEAEILGVDVTELPLPVSPGGLSLGYVNIDADFLRAFVRVTANETDSDFDVLSAPHVLTLDNEKAVINISDNVPFITSSLTDTGGTDLAQSETFEYRDVGIVLEITPHISPDRMVRLEIVQKVNEVGLIERGISAGALSEKKREVETTVMVRDRHTLVLGGLMKEGNTVNVSKVPFLGDIPILGWAFKTRSVTKEKKNLLIFITPSIVTNMAEATDVTMQKTGEVNEDLQERMGDSLTLQRGLFAINDEEPVDDAPPEDVPSEQILPEVTLGVETPVAEAPVAEAPIAEVPIEDAPAEDTPVEEIPAEDVPEDEAAAEPYEAGPK